MIPLILSTWTPIVLTEVIAGATAAAVTGKKIYDLCRWQISKNSSKPIEQLPKNDVAPARIDDRFSHFLKSSENLSRNELFYVDYRISPPAITEQLFESLSQFLNQLQVGFIQDAARDQQMLLIKIVETAVSQAKCSQEPLFNMGYDWEVYLAESGRAESILKTALELKKILPTSWADSLRTTIREVANQFEAYLLERKQRLASQSNMVDAEGMLALRLKQSGSKN